MLFEHSATQRESACNIPVRQILTLILPRNPAFSEIIRIFATFLRSVRTGPREQTMIPANNKATEI